MAARMVAARMLAVRVWWDRRAVVDPVEPTVVIAPDNKSRVHVGSIQCQANKAPLRPLQGKFAAVSSERF